MASLAREPRLWRDRSTQLDALLQRPGIAAALSAVRQRATQLRAGHVLPRPQDDSVHGCDVDAALALLWAPHSGLSGAERAELARVPELMLHEADYTSVRNLQRGGPGMVDLVRCRHDGRVYVLKSTLKGAAGRERYRINPMLEKRIFLKALASGRAADLSSTHTRDTTETNEDALSVLPGEFWGCLPTPRLHTAFQSHDAAHLVMEYCPAGDLEALLAAAGAADASYPGKSRVPGALLDESWILSYAKDICAAVAWLHGIGFAHRDVKPANFLLHSSGHLKICDFGTAAPFSWFDSPESSTREWKRRLVQHLFCQKPAGTCDYIAPEILLHEEEKLAGLYHDGEDSLTLPPDSSGAYGPEVDWWSVGVVLYEMTYGSLPFWADRPSEAYYRIRNHTQFFHLDERVPISDGLRSLLSGLLAEPSQRLGRYASEEVLSHAFFASSDPTTWATAPPPFLPTVDESVILPDQSYLASGQADMPLFQDSFDHTSSGACLSISILPPAADRNGDRDTEMSEAEAMDSSTSTPLQSASDAEADDEHEHEHDHDIDGADYNWLGFTHRPGRHCFDHATHSHVPTIPEDAPMDVEASMSWTPSVPSTRKGGLGPLVSTPFGRPGPSSFPSSTPAMGLGAGATVGTGIGVGMGAGNAFPVECSFAVPRLARFSTPARPMAPGIAASVPPSQVPPSPYPFPQAALVVPTPAPIPAPSRWAPPSLRPSKMDHSVGSDTRCSGGSNAKREVSESEAWREMMRAVQQSARKLRQGQKWTPLLDDGLMPPATWTSKSRRPTAFARHQARKHLAPPDHSLPSSWGRDVSPSFPSDDESRARLSERSASTGPTSPLSRGDGSDKPIPAGSPIMRRASFEGGGSSEPDSASEGEDWISASPSAARRASRPSTALARLSSSDEAEQPRVGPIRARRAGSYASARMSSEEAESPFPRRSGSRAGLPMPRRLFTKTASMPTVPQLRAEGPREGLTPPMPFVGRGLSRTRSDAAPFASSDSFRSSAGPTALDRNSSTRQNRRARASSRSQGQRRIKSLAQSAAPQGSTSEAEDSFTAAWMAHRLGAEGGQVALPALSYGAAATDEVAPHSVAAALTVPEVCVTTSASAKADKLHPAAAHTGTPPAALGMPGTETGTPLTALYERTAREIQSHGQVFADLRQRLKGVHLTAAQWASELSP